MFANELGRNSKRLQIRLKSIINWRGDSDDDEISSLDFTRSIEPFLQFLDFGLVDIKADCAAMFAEGDRNRKTNIAESDDCHRSFFHLFLPAPIVPKVFHRMAEGAAHVNKEAGLFKPEVW